MGRKKIAITIKNIKKKPVIPVFAGMALIFFLGLAFFSRKPVIVVTDRAFTALYGEKRTRLKRLGISIRVFRRIKVALVAEEAGPDVAAQAAMGLSRRPLAVFFPYRYREGALRYVKERPGFPVIILGGRNLPPDGTDTSSPVWLTTDTETDLYRAGIFAGLAARYMEQNSEETRHKPEVALFWDGLEERNPRDEAKKTAFEKGVGEYWPGIPLFSPNPEEQYLACAVLMGDYRFNWEKIPRSLIFFTWMDSALTPGKTLAVFDDSPWAQIIPALKLLRGKPAGTENLVPSEITVPRRNKLHKNEYLAIKRLKTLKYQGKTADN